jgi:HAD superfamily hydrolase (TIGR01509 family)
MRFAPRSTPRAEPGAVVFDLDGVLIDSEGVWDDARRAVVAASGGSWREGATREMLGMSAPEWSLYLHEQLGSDLDPAQIRERVVDQVLDRYRRSLPLLPGAAAAVESLAERWPLGLASSANRVVIEEVLKLAGLGGRFAVTVSSEEVSRGKPAPDVYLAAVDALGVNAGAAVAVEDSSNGLRAASAAGMRVVAVPNRQFPPSPDALALADLTLSSLELLRPETIESLGDPGG